MDSSLDRMNKIFGEGQIKASEPMSLHTTFRIGGPADFYFEARTSSEIKKSVAFCRESSIPYFVLGIGANLLVADKGVRGMVIKPINGEIEILGSFVEKRAAPKSQSSSRHQSFDEIKYLKFNDLDLTEPPPDSLVRVGAGASLPVLISRTLEAGLTGLQNFAGIPASLGGAIYNNIHGGNHLFEELVESVTLLEMDGTVRRVGGDQMEFAYDWSRLHQKKAVVLEATLALSHGDAARARATREEWLRRKLRVQPQTNCPGCVFRNLTIEESRKIGAPSVAAGWVLDIGLALKGKQIGQVKISEKHANFFVNLGRASSRDVLALIRYCQEQARDKFGIELREEVERVGEF